MRFRVAVARAFRRWGRYSGRSTRLEHVATLLTGYLGLVPLTVFVSTAAGADSDLVAFGFVPLLVAVQGYHASLVRRLHDTGRSGWWTVPPVTYISAPWMLFARSGAENQYGPPHA